jgi:hypothetical protein
MCGSAGGWDEHQSREAKHYPGDDAELDHDPSYGMAERQ